MNNNLRYISIGLVLLILRNATMIVQDETKFIEIESPQIIFQVSNERIDSEIGRVRIYDKKEDSEESRTDVNYKN